MLDRVSGPVLSPDGRTVVLQLRETDYAGNKGKNSLWTVPSAGGKPQRLIDGATSPRWSVDGGSLFFLAPKDGINQLWRISAKGGQAEAVSNLALDVGSYRLSPDGKAVLLTAE